MGHDFEKTTEIYLYYSAQGFTLLAKNESLKNKINLSS